MNIPQTHSKAPSENNDPPDPERDGDRPETRSDESNSRQKVRIVRLVEACQNQSPVHGLQFLLKNDYHGFFIRLPLGFHASVRRERIVEAPAPSLRATQPSFSVGALYNIPSVEFLQVRDDNLGELAIGQTTSAFEFGDFVLSPEFRHGSDDRVQEFYALEVGRIVLRPQNQAVANRTPHHMTGSGPSSPAKSFTSQDGSQTFLISHLSIDDLYIEEGRLGPSETLAPSLIIDKTFTEPQDATEAQDASKLQAASVSKAMEEIEAKNLDPMNFKQHCPAVYEIMAIARVRVTTHLTDPIIEDHFRKKYGSKTDKRTYKSPLGNNNRARFAAQISRANFESRSKGLWQILAPSRIGSETFIQQDSYSTTLKLIMTIASRWVESDRSKQTFEKILGDFDLEIGHQDAPAGKITWLVVGHFDFGSTRR